MGIFDSLNSLFDAVTPWATAEAEAPTPTDEGEEEVENSSDEDKVESKEASSADRDEEEPEEEEEEEPVDPKEKLEEECKESHQCAGPKHHFDECVERVTGVHGEKQYANEDCVEEFFHLTHCAGQCAAPKLWSVLK